MENSAMKTVSLASLFLAAALGLGLAGCSSTSLDDKGAPVETRTPNLSDSPMAPTAGATTGAAAQSQVATVDLAAGGAGAAGGAAGAALPHVVYFAFDSFTLQDDGKPVIEGWARALAANRKRHVTVEGYTDERGSTEYNLALGQKRAEAVTSALGLLGADPKQMDAVSFGKENPADPGHDEAAWAKNRRAELKDR
ncbi:MAG: OmpA family protein [Burkholderiales bacterium]|nr:OmpA family protein [Burkholderiales bacterium]MDE2453060.1 OmpA family protein [Burkholderiales bacterium]